MPTRTQRRNTAYLNRLKYRVARAGCGQFSRLGARLLGQAALLDAPRERRAFSEAEAQDAATNAAAQHRLP